MRLTVVGCSGSLPGPDSPASCYLVEADGFRMVLDLGNGSLGALQRGIELDALDAVLLSHLHADHCLDLCSLYVARTYHPTGRRPALPVFGPAGTADRLARAYGAAAAQGVEGAFSFRSWRAWQPYEIGPFTVTVGPVFHSADAYGIRVQHAGRVLTYSGDTDACPELVELARDADLLLCEASYEQGQKTAPGVHLTGREAGAQATAAGARALVLTHVPPWNDPDRARTGAAETYRGALETARPGAGYDV